MIWTKYFAQANHSLVNIERIHLSTPEVLAISQEVDRLGNELDALDASDPYHADRIDSIIRILERHDRTISIALGTPSRSHLKLVG